MNRLWLIPLALLLTALSVNPTQAEEDAALAGELAALREAWLYADDETAGARLDTLRNDDRLTGELSRWYGFMRAALALQQGDTDTAWQCIEPVLEDLSLIHI